MRATADTNVLVRAATGDDPKQSKTAVDLLSNAEIVVVTASALCEFVWVLRQGFRAHPAEIAASLQSLIASQNVVVANRPLVEAGLTQLLAGGDFADAVIAREGESFGADVFVTFDKRAAKQLELQGFKTQLLT